MTVVCKYLAKSTGWKFNFTDAKSLRTSIQRIKESLPKKVPKKKVKKPVRSKGKGKADDPANTADTADESDENVVPSRYGFDDEHGPFFSIASTKFYFDAPEEVQDVFSRLFESVKIVKVELPRFQGLEKFIAFFVLLASPSQFQTALDNTDMEQVDGNLLEFFSRQKFDEVSTHFESIFVNWNSTSNYKLGATLVKVSEINSLLDLFLGKMAKSKESYFRLLGGELSSVQVNAVLRRLCGMVKSYISNKRDIFRLFSAHVFRGRLPFDWQFVDPHESTVQMYLEPSKVELLYIDKNGHPQATPLLNSKTQKKVDLKQFAVEHNGHSLLYIYGIKFLDMELTIDKKYSFVTQKSCNPLVEASHLVYHAGDVCFSRTATGIVCNIPIAQHVDMLATSTDSVKNTRLNVLHQPHLVEDQPMQESEEEEELHQPHLVEDHPMQESEDEPMQESEEVEEEEEVVLPRRVRRKQFKREMEKRRMAKLGFQPWTYVEGRDPLLLKTNDSLGCLYVLRSKIKQDVNWKSIFKDVLCNDPGLNFFKVYFNVGTLDYYILMPSISNDLRFIDHHISEKQSELDGKLNQVQELQDLKREMDQAMMNRLTMDHESDDQKKGLLEAYETAANVYWDRRTRLSNEDDLSKEISHLHLVSKLLVEKLHATSKLFETAFGTLVEPDFKADQKLLEKKPSELGKSWKKTASSLSHARLRNAVIRKQAVLGQCFVLCSEACSTLGCGFCAHPNSPGRKKNHSCNWSKCKKIGIRDFSGSVIARIALERCLGLARQSNQTKVRETEFPKLEVQSKVSKTTSQYSENLFR